MPLVEISRWESMLISLRLRKPVDPVGEYCDNVIRELEGIGFAMNGQGDHEKNFLALYSPALEYFGKTGDMKPVQIWNYANRVYLRMIGARSKYNGFIETVKREGKEGIENILRSVELEVGARTEESVVREPVGVSSGNGGSKSE